jgi:hypothetical protein
VPYEVVVNVKYLQDIEDVFLSKKEGKRKRKEVVRV